MNNSNIDRLHVERIANHVYNDKILIKILRDKIEVLDEKRASNVYTANEVVYELERITPQLIAMCDVLVSEAENNHDQLYKLSDDAIDENE